MAAKRGKKDTEGTDPSALRVPPHDLAAEAALLGAALLNGQALEVLATRTQPGDFYAPAHAAVAAACAALFAAGEPADAVTVADELRRQGAAVDDVDLVALISGTPSTSSAGRYADIVHDHATTRRLISAAAAIAETGYGGTADAHGAVLRAQELLEGVASQNGARTYSNLVIPDLAEILAGDYAPVEADFLTRTDGKALFYAGKMHMLQAEPSSGKSWIALLAVVEVLALGGSAVYLDYEDTARGIVDRLRALAAHPDAIASRFRYIRPDGAFGPPERAELRHVLDTLNPDIVVIDGVAESLSRDGYDEDKAKDVVAWIEKLPRWIARTGAAVVMLDHVTKSKENRGRDARGSGHKRAAVDGAAYEVIVTEPWSRHRSGKARLVIAKDRPSGVGAVGETAAVAEVRPAGDGAVLRIDLQPYTAESSIADPWKPTIVMAKVSRELEQAAQDITPTAMKALLASTKPKLVEEAIARLVQEGHVETARKGSTTILRLLRPYPPDGDGPPPPTGRRYTDEELFADLPGETRDELAERRARKDTDR